MGTIVHRPGLALKAKAFENSAKIAGKAVVKVEISNISKAKLPLQHLQLGLKRRRPAA